MIASTNTVSLPKVFSARVQHGRSEQNLCHCLLPVSMLFGYQKLANLPRLRKSLRRGGRVFRDISKVLSQEDLVDYSDEEAPVKIQQQLPGSEHWHTSQPASSERLEAFQALQRLHQRKAFSVSPDGVTSQVMPAFLASTAQSTFYETQAGQAGADVSGRRLRSELTSEEAFSTLRADARRLLAARRSSDVTEPELEAQVNDFLKRSWANIVTNAGPAPQSDEPKLEPDVWIRRAQLFGAVLGLVPDTGLRSLFEARLTEWARRKDHLRLSGSSPSASSKPARRIASLQELTTKLLQSEGRSEEEMRISATKVLRLLLRALSTTASKAQRKRLGSPAPAQVAEAIGAIAQLHAQLLEERREALPDLFRPLDAEAVASAALWATVREHCSAAVRLALLESLLEHIDDTFLPVLSMAEIAATDVVGSCLDFAFREEEEEDFFRHVPLPRRAKTRRGMRRRRRQPGEWWGPSTAVRLEGPLYAIPSRKPLSKQDLLDAPEQVQEASAAQSPEMRNALGEQKERELAERHERRRFQDAATARAAALLLRHLIEEDETCIADTSPEEALRLVVVFARHLGGVVAVLANPVLEDARQNPLEYVEADLLELCKALRSQPAKAPCWKQLAEVFLLRWRSLQPEALAAQVEVLHKRLVAMPSALRQALLVASEKDPFALRHLSWQQMSVILEIWDDRRPPDPPLSLCFLLAVAMDQYIVCFPASQLVLACRLASMDDMQDLEVPKELGVPDFRSLALEWWDRWLRGALSNWITGWGFCRAALQQALAWQRRDREGLAKALTARVLDVVENLGMELEQVPVPLELLLDVLELPGNKLQEELIAELQRRVAASLQGNEPLVPIETAVALACGRRLVPCPKDSELWGGLVESIALQLTSKRQVDIFDDCRPREDLWNAVSQLKAGTWQSLELQIRRPSANL